MQASFSNSHNSGSICCTLPNGSISFVRDGHQNSVEHLRLSCHFGLAPVWLWSSGPTLVDAEHRLVHSCTMIHRELQISVLMEARIMKRAQFCPD